MLLVLFDLDHLPLLRIHEPKGKVSSTQQPRLRPFGVVIPRRRTVVTLAAQSARGHDAEV